MGGDVSVSYSHNFVVRAAHQISVDRIEFYAIQTAFVASYVHSDLLNKACHNITILSSAAKTTGTDRHTGHCMAENKATCFGSAERPPLCTAQRSNARRSTVEARRETN